MRKATSAFVLTLVVVFAIGAVAQMNSNSIISSGTQITVRTDQAIDVKGNDSNNNPNNNSNNYPNNGNNYPNNNYPNNGPNSTYNGDQIYSGTIANDIMDRQGRVAIPSGSPVQLAVVNTGDNQLTLDLRSITVNGQTYNTYSDSSSAAASNKNGGLGTNKRTGEYVGGGALAGTIIGAVAGGAKGALIGAIAGGAAGAGAQVLTKGKNLSIPAETKLDFRINRDLNLGPYEAPSRDNRMPVPQSH